MIDLNNLISSALTAAVAEATKPLLERIEKLENENRAYEVLHRSASESVAVLRERVIALETKLTEANLFTKTTEVTVPIDEARLVEVLDQQEWFWEKLTRKAGEAAQAVTDEAINDHCDTYNHDDYDSAAAALDDYDLDDFLVRGDLEEAINRALDSATISIRV